ncbi:MAG: rhomboid family intramembrane serine protease, partial [Deltaproteobacteria bacterium]|nr:rhomboid family intramembrane serine protease [Deltaproteobacteria bacterium]
SLARYGRYAVAPLSAAGMKDDLQIDAGHVGLLVRAGLVHTSPGHLLMNAIGLVLIGVLGWRLTPLAMRTLSRAATLAALGIVASTVGFLASYLVRAGPSCGASAAVYGLFAAAAAEIWARRKDLPSELRTLVPIIMTALSLGTAFVFIGRPGMDHAAHLGGWLAGFLGGFALPYRAGRLTLGGLATALLIAAFL